MSSTPQAAPTKILLVDDDDLVRRAFSRAIGSAGFEVDVAKDAWAAMKQARRANYAVVVLDYRMPGLNGLELKEELEVMLPDASYILLSGNVDLDLALEAVNQHSVAHVIAKPWEVNELVSTLNRASEACWERVYARQVASRAVDNSRGRSRAEELMSAEARALISALAARSSELAEMGQRVGALTRRIAEACGVTGQELVEMELGGMLSDIGYLAIPDAILKKQGGLTPEDVATIRRHPEVGDQLLCALPNLAVARRIVRESHERWDGTGYPGKLTGENIHLGARIVALAATIDALTTDRPYRAALPLADVRAEIVALAGSQFDPQVIAAFETMTEAQLFERKAEASQGKQEGRGEPASDLDEVEAELGEDDVEEDAEKDAEGAAAKDAGSQGDAGLSGSSEHAA